MKLIAPAYVKPFVKRQKNDMADAEAICEAAQRPTMRFVALKSANQQAAAVVFRTRDLLVRQRTQAINALRGHLAEFGVIAAKGPAHTSKLIAALEDPASDLPQRRGPFWPSWSRSSDRWTSALPGSTARSPGMRRRTQSRVG